MSKIFIIFSGFIMLSYKIINIKSQGEMRIFEGDEMRILEGDPANKSMWPFIVAVTCGQIHHCGGSLIKPSWVLTSAHCVQGKALDTQKKCLGNVTVRIGPDDLTYINITAYLNEQCQNFNLKKTLFSAIDAGTGILVSKVFTHPKYFIERFVTKEAPLEVVAYDVALLELGQSFDAIHLAALPTKSIYDANVCTVAGWGLRGRVQQAIGEKNDLQELNITIMDEGACVKLIGTMYELSPENLTAYKLEAASTNIVCGNGETAVQTILAGDSGGPLICDGQLQGVASLVLLKEDKEGKLSYSGVFAEVSDYILWINSVLSENNYSIFNVDELYTVPETTDTIGRKLPEEEEMEMIDDETDKSETFIIFFTFWNLIFISGANIFLNR